MAIDAAQFADDDDTIRHKLKKKKELEGKNALTQAQIMGRVLIGFAVFATVLAGYLLYNLGL